MSKHLGDFDASTVVYGKFTTFRPSTGAAFTLGGTPALSVYKDNSTTQSTTGVTLTADFDAVTGLNHFAIDTSADGTFYSAGSFFEIIVTTGTVDSVSVVGAVVASFTIRKNSSLKPATAGRTLVVDAAGLADANMVKAGPSGSGTAQTARDIGGNVDVATSTRLASASYTAPDNATITAIAGYVDTEVAAIKAKTDNLPSDPASASTIASSFSGVNSSLSTIAGYIDTEVAAIKAKTDNLPASPAAVGSAMTLAAGQVQIKKNTALSNFMFVMTDSTTHAPSAGLTVTATRSIDGASFASCANSVSAVSNGVYKINLAAADLNGDSITFRFTATGADDRLITIIPQP